MKKNILLGILVVAMLLCAACGKKKEKDEIDIIKLDISKLPVHHIEMTDDDDLILQVPEQKIVTETQGEIVDTFLDEEYVYYLIFYDYYYTSYCKEIGVCRQSISTGDIEEIYYNTSMPNCYYYSNSLYVDEAVVSWVGANDAGDEKKYIISNNDYEVVDYVEESSVDINDIFSDYSITGECTENICRFIGKTENKIVWEQWEEEYYFNNCYIYIYNIENGQIHTIDKEEYGVVHSPVMYNNYICFQTIDDIKSYSNNDDFYSNVYVYDVEKLKETRITSNFGDVNSIDCQIFSDPKAMKCGIVVVERDKRADEFSYKLTYVIK